MSKSKRKMSWIKKCTLFLFKLLSAIIVGFFASLIGQALMEYNYFSFMFIFLTVWFAFFTLIKKLGFLGVLFIDLLFILIIVLIRFYIIMADGR